MNAQAFEIGCANFEYPPCVWGDECLPQRRLALALGAPDINRVGPDVGTGVIRLQDFDEVLTQLSAAVRAVLAHAEVMAPPTAVHRDLADGTVRVLRHVQRAKI